MSIKVSLLRRWKPPADWSLLFPAGRVFAAVDVDGRRHVRGSLLLPRLFLLAWLSRYVIRLHLHWSTISISSGKPGGHFVGLLRGEWKMRHRAWGAGYCGSAMQLFLGVALPSLGSLDGGASCLPLSCCISVKFKSPNPPVPLRSSHCLFPVACSGHSFPSSYRLWGIFLTRHCGLIYLF